MGGSSGARLPTPQGNTRVTGKEQFYTPPSIASSVVDIVLSVVPDATRRPWLEPAGGTGAFVDAARAVGVLDVVSVDIEPLHPQVALGDFLAMQLDLRGAVTVSNPPFGRNNSLSVPFFNRSAEYSDYIAFIVPRSWRKWSVINRLDPYFHLVADEDLSINYVDADGVGRIRAKPAADLHAGVGAPKRAASEGVGGRSRSGRSKQPRRRPMSRSPSSASAAAPFARSFRVARSLPRCTSPCTIRVP